MAIFRTPQPVARMKRTALPVREKLRRGRPRMKRPQKGVRFSGATSTESWYRRVATAGSASRAEIAAFAEDKQVLVSAYNRRPANGTRGHAAAEAIDEKGAVCNRHRRNRLHCRNCRIGSCVGHPGARKSECDRAGLDRGQMAILAGPMGHRQSLRLHAR